MGLFSQGTLQLTPVQQDQQKRAQEELGMYWKQQAPAMAQAIQMTNQAPAFSQMQAGAGAQSGRNVAAQEGTQAAAASTNTGAMPGSGAFNSRQSSILASGAGTAGYGATMGRSGANTAYYNRVNNIAGQGNAIVKQADSALNTAAQIQAEQYAANVQSKSQDMEDFSNMMSQMSNMSGMSSMGGGMGGGGGGGG